MPHIIQKFKKFSIKYKLFKKFSKIYSSKNFLLIHKLLNKIYEGYRLRKNINYSIYNIEKT